MIEKMQTPEQFERWYKKAKPGDRVSYYEGFLFRERTELAFRKVFTVPAHLLPASKAWEMYLEERVALIQKRLGPGHYVYLAYKL